MPGNIVQGLRKAGARHCVMMLDEVDKVSASAHGDPSAALLEVLDPEQNSTFRDNYLGVPFDLSRVVFIATANVIDNVPAPVRDRMEVIELPGYTQEEKLQIARTYLVPRQREANGLREDQCELSDAALRTIIADYTREAGVRQLEREIGRVMRHAAMKVAEGSAAAVRVDAADLDAILGPAEVRARDRRCAPACPASRPAWPGRRWAATSCSSRPRAWPAAASLILTGQLGDVMKESAQAALTLVKSRAGALRHRGRQRSTHIDVHVHVPAGAIPKDGPSAGVAMFIALASLFTDRAVRHDVAMTGEISLRGLVLPVGGIKEKVLAAQRAGVAHGAAARAQREGPARRARIDARGASVRVAADNRRRGACRARRHHRAGAARALRLVLNASARASASASASDRRPWLLAGVVGIAGLALFAAIAWGVSSSKLVAAWDRQPLAGLRGHVTASWLHALGAVSHWHRPQAVATASALALAVLLWRRQGVDALWLLCTVGGGATLNDWVKHAVRRPRPGDEGLSVVATDFSFPSGHVANATLLYGALALLLVGHLRARAWQAAVLLAAAGAVVLVAASRLALGAHYPSDVAAGAALALAWLSLCAGARHAWQRRASGG